MAIAVERVEIRSTVAPVIDAFRQIGYQGGLYVELSRHRHMAPEAAKAAHEFLGPLMQKAGTADA